ncbi:enoyl-CoA hydratase-related protein [Qipengyuania sp. DSG2-2]|uniref:enoyl-CoA hydratase-related protein n=1 Tax=Qipengyuania sp. DGS2-2 TaxID=3349631 RepID=UPI0036D3C104
MSYETIRTEQDGNVLKITLNRPERLNACPPQMADEIFAALRDLGDARAVLITGEGRAFCSGADLAANAEGGASIEGGARSYTALQKHYNPMIQMLANVPVPVVAAVGGPAAGVGCSIALAADFVLAGKKGYFLQAFVNIGLVPDGGSSWMLPRLIGLAQATRMMMLGERIHGEEAERLGLIYKCVEDDALMAEAEALAHKLADGPTIALGQMKQTLRAGLESDFANTLRAEAEGQRVAGNSKDARIGAIAFLKKTKAEFTGS